MYVFGRSRGRGRGRPRGPRQSVPVLPPAADSVDAAEAADSVDAAAPAVHGKGPPHNNTLRMRSVLAAISFSEKQRIHSKEQPIEIS